MQKDGITLKIVAFVLSFVLLAACGQTSFPNPPEAPQRVAACSKSLAELWLLAGGELTGVTQDALELPGLEQDTPVIGTVSKPNPEAILALEPELVLLSGELTAQKQLQTELERAGIACLPVEINSFADYRVVMETLTGLTGRDDLFQANVVETEARIISVLERAAALVDENRETGKTYLAMRVSATKNKTLKNDYFACEIISAFGISNIAEDNSALDELNLEAVVAANPDYIFVIPQGDEAEAEQSYREAFSGHAIWGELDAVKIGRVFVLPKELFQYKPNAWWDEAYESIYSLLLE